VCATLGMFLCSCQLMALTAVHQPCGLLPNPDGLFPWPVSGASKEVGTRWQRLDAGNASSAPGYKSALRDE